MTNDDFEYLDADQREAITDCLQSGHERASDESDDTDEENAGTQFTVESGGAVVAVTYSQSAGVVSASNEHLDEAAFEALENELETVAAQAGVGEPESHERMSEFVSYRVDFT